MRRPLGVRARLMSAVAPVGRASKPGSQGCAQMPEKSGTDPPSGGACPDAGAAATAANAAAISRFRLRFILASRLRSDATIARHESITPLFGASAEGPEHALGGSACHPVGPL